MASYDLAGDSCLIIPVITIFIILLILTLIVLLNKRKKDENRTKEIERIVIVVSVLLTVCILILSLTINSYYQRYVEHEPYQGWYEFEIYIEYNEINKSNMEIDLPLPHDSRIYSEFDFEKSSPSQYLTFSINESKYGKVLHLETNNALIIRSNYFDDQNDIDPTLRLSTQDNNIAFVNLAAQKKINVSIILYFGHSWRISLTSFSEKTRYISISKEPFYVPNEIQDYQKPELANILSEEGVELSLGWNELNITNNEYIMWE